MQNRQQYANTLGCTLLLVGQMATLTAQTAPKPQGNGSRYINGSMTFNTDATRVFAALAKYGKLDIVIPENIRTTVTVSLHDMSVQDAFRLVAIQAGVAYRQIGKVAVIAPVEKMQKVLEQYGTEERIPLSVIETDDAVKKLSASYPFVTVRPAGRSLILIGAPEDLDKAKLVLRDMDTGGKESNSSAAVLLTHVPSTDIEQVLTAQFPTLKAKKVGESSVAFSGPESDVQRAQAFIKDLDKGKLANVRFVVYHIKYSSALALVTSLKETIQSLTVVAGPEPFHIPKTRIDLSTANSLGSSQAGGGQSGGGQSGGGQGGGGGGGDTGNSGGAGGGGGANAGGSGRSSNGEKARTIILGGPAESVDKGLDLLRQLDVPVPQVVLDVKVVSTSPQTTSNLGIEWSPSIGTTIFERPNLKSGDPANDFPGTTGAAIRQNFSVGNFGRLPISFNATLNAFFQRQDVRIMAKPTITALDNEEGVVFVGETRRVLVSNIQPGANNLVINNIVEIPVGIILQMRPRVNEGDQIQLHVHPIYSSVGTVNAATGLFSTFQREAETTVRVTSGETIVIGGLLQDEDTKTFTKVPFLGDLPLIGHFFRNTNKTRLKREVLVFVTPHLLKD